MGPVDLAQPVDGTLPWTHSVPWAIELRRSDNKLHAYKRVGNSWVEQTSQLPPLFQEELGPNVRRVSAASDQSARLTVAYEENGIVKVTRWSPSQNQYVQNVSFPGYNPTLLMDATVSRSIPDSDIILFYQEADPGESVHYRLQRDGYGQEKTLIGSGAFLHTGIQTSPDSSFSLNTQGGWQFEVTGEDITVGALRLRTPTNTTETVRLWRVSDQALLAEASISTVGGLYSEQPINPVTLPVGTRYIVTQSSGGANRSKYRGGSTPSWHPNITYIDTHFASDEGYPSGTSTAGIRHGPDIRFALASEEQQDTPKRILDRAVALAYRYQVLMSDAQGNPLNDGGMQAFVSALYPVPAYPRVNLDAEFVEGDYRETVVNVEPARAVELETFFLDANYRETVVLVTPARELELETFFLPAEYRAVVTLYERDLNVLVDAAFHAGSYAEIATPYAYDADFNVDAAFVEGAYYEP